MTTAQRELLELRESGAPLTSSALQPDGTVLVHVIRPGIGRGKGRHYYSPEMLRESAGKWAGLKMYVNHLSEAARKALAGMPRDVRDLGGRIIESHWDESVPADDRFEQGAVVARVKPVPWIANLIGSDPELVETSISASATAVRPSRRRGLNVAEVEDIAENPDRPGVIAGSLDWVTEAGAGGKVLAAIQESYVSDADNERIALDLMDDTEIRAYLRENHAELAEALGVGETEDDQGSSESEEEDVEITPDALREALADPEVREVLAEIVNPLVEARFDDERDIIISEAQAEIQRGIDLRDMRTDAHTQIDEALAGLPDVFRQKAKARFEINGTTPTDTLDVFDRVDENGTVTKPRGEALTEAVEAVVAEYRELAGAGNRTTIRGQGRAVVESTDLGDDAEGGDDDAEGVDPKRRVDPGTRQMLRESGMTDDEIDESYSQPLTSVVG